MATTTPTESEFRRVVERVRTGPQAQLSDETRLQFYALFKQGSEGNAPPTPPATAWWKLLEKEKRARMHDAWASQRHVPREVAQQQYIALYRTHGGT